MPPKRRSSVSEAQAVDASANPHMTRKRKSEIERLEENVKRSGSVAATVAESSTKKDTKTTVEPPKTPRRGRSSGKVEKDTVVEESNTEVTADSPKKGKRRTRSQNADTPKKVDTVPEPTVPLAPEELPRRGRTRSQAAVDTTGTKEDTVVSEKDADTVFVADKSPKRGKGKTKAQTPDSSGAQKKVDIVTDTVKKDTSAVPVAPENTPKRGRTRAQSVVNTIATKEEGTVAVPSDGVPKSGRKRAGTAVNTTGTRGEGMVSNQPDEVRKGGRKRARTAVDTMGAKEEGTVALSASTQKVKPRKRAQTDTVTVGRMERERKAKGGERKERGRGRSKGREMREEVETSDRPLAKEETQDEREHRYRSTITQMMFVSGDSANPHQENVDTVYDMVHYQLTTVLKNAWSKVLERGASSIECADVIFEMRRRPDILKRLLKLAAAAANLRNIDSSWEENAQFKVREESDQEEEEITEGTSDKIIDFSLVSYANHYDRICAAIERLHLGITVKGLEEMNDTVGDLRAHRLAKRVRYMDTDDYNEFVEARSTVLCKTNARRAQRTLEHNSLTHWLGNPTLGAGVVFVLNFVAKETVAQFVDFAYRIASGEGHTRYAKNARGQKVALPRSAHYVEVGTLDSTHYSTALVRSAPFNVSGDFLFGPTTGGGQGTAIDESARATLLEVFCSEPEQSHPKSLSGPSRGSTK